MHPLKITGLVYGQKSRAFSEEVFVHAPL